MKSAPLQEEVTSLAFSPNGRLIAIGIMRLRKAANEYLPSRFELRDVATGQLQAAVENDIVARPAVLFSSSGNFLYLQGLEQISNDKFTAKAVAWDMESNNELWQLEIPPHCFLHALTLSPNGKLLAAPWQSMQGDVEEAAPNCLGLWDSQSGKLVDKFRGSFDDVTLACFTPDSQSLVLENCGKDNENYTYDLRRINTTTGELTRRIELTPFAPRQMAINPQTGLIGLVLCEYIDGSLDYPVLELRDLEREGHRVRLALPEEVVDPYIEFLAFTPNGEQLWAVATFEDIQKARLLLRWDVAHAHSLPPVELGVAHCGYDLAIALSADARTIALSHPKRGVQLYRTSDGMQVQELPVIEEVKPLFNLDDEIRYLQNGPQRDEKPMGLSVETLHVSGENPQAILAKCKEVLGTMFHAAPADYSNPPGWWRERLPGWFVSQCAREKTIEESQEWFAWWQTLTSEERLSEKEKAPWSLRAWLFWFTPDNRTWFWWDSEITGAHTLLIHLCIVETPGALGALEWLLRTAGATEVQFGFA